MEYNTSKDEVFENLRYIENLKLNEYLSPVLMSGYYNKSKEFIIMCDIKFYKHGGFNMIVTDEEVMEM